MKNEKRKTKIKKSLRFFNLFFIVGSIFLFPPIISQAAIAITPPDHFIGDGTLSGGTASLIKVNIVDEEPGAYYLKAYFYPPSKTQARFGYVWNPTTNHWVSTWQKNSEQIQIEVAPNKQWNGTPVKGLWQGEISVKTDIEKSGYLGSGDYILKVRATPVTTGHAIEISTNASITESSAGPGGTPKTMNSQSTTSPVIPSDSEESHPSETPEQHNTGDSSAAPPLQNDDGSTKPAAQPELELQIIEYPKNIFINEILPAPEGPDEQNEWVEIFNANDFAVNLAGWQIKDITGTIKTYTLPDNSQVPANGFLLIPRPESKITLQNNGDGLELLNPQGEMSDQVAYYSALSNQSYNRDPASPNGTTNWVWSKILTPGAINKIPENSKQTIMPAVIKQTTSSPQIASPLDVTSVVAQINRFAPKSSRVLSFILGLIIALISAIIVFFLRKRDKEQPFL